jgi:hypothetical protein
VDLFASRRLRFAQPYTRTSTVLVDELDAGGLESTTYDVKSCAAGLAKTRLQLVDRYDTYTGTRREFLLTPIKKSSRCSTL